MKEQPIPFHISAAIHQRLNPYSANPLDYLCPDIFRGEISEGG
jgi:hypothetical protein